MDYLTVADSIPHRRSDVSNESARKVRRPSTSLSIDDRPRLRTRKRRVSSIPSSTQQPTTHTGFSLDEWGEVAAKGEFREVSTKKIAQTSNFLLELKKGLALNMNVDVQETIPQQDDISHGTKVRAEKVATYINAYYLIMEKNMVEADHPGVEGVYNPLQILRNRRVRKKYGEAPAVVSLKTPPLASEVFSRHKKPIFWQITLSERASDITWRHRHWNDLKCPDGSYWFRNSPRISREIDLSVSKECVYSTGDDTAEDPVELSSNVLTNIPIVSVYGANNYASSGSSLSAVNSNASHIHPGLSHSTSYIGTHRLSNSASHSVSHSLSNNASHGMSQSLSNSASQSMSHIPSHLQSHTNGFLPVPSHSQSHSRDSSHISESVSELFNQSSVALPVELMNKVENQISASHDDDKHDCELLKQVYKLRQIAAFLDLATNSMSYKTLHYDKVFTITGRAESIQLLIGHLKQEVQRLDAHLTENIKRSDEYRARFINEFSTKVDTLLLSSDRIISELNTSMTLKLKSLDERIEKMSPLLSTKFNLGYRVLENIIVAMLWSIWLIMKVFNMFKFIIVIIYSAIKWLWT